VENVDAKNQKNFLKIKNKSTKRAKNRKIKHSGEKSEF